jgi:hypothetical protein
MSFSEQSIVDKIEVVQNGTIHVRTTTNILKNDVVVASNVSRKSFPPGSDISGQDEKIQTIAASLWTQELIDAYNEQVKKSSIGEMQNNALSLPSAFN